MGFGEGRFTDLLLSFIGMCLCGFTEKVCWAGQRKGSSRCDGRATLAEGAQRQIYVYAEKRWNDSRRDLKTEVVVNFGIRPLILPPPCFKLPLSPSTPTVPAGRTGLRPTATSEPTGRRRAAIRSPIIDCSARHGCVCVMLDGINLDALEVYLGDHSRLPSVVLYHAPPPNL